MKLSKEAYKKATEELAYRKEVLAPKLGALIVESAAQGDGIHDNVQLRDTRNEIQVNLDVIARLEEMIRTSDATESKSSESIQIGSSVTIKDLETGNEKQLQITSSEALNYVSNAVSDKSLIGSALIGKKKGDAVSITLPNGKVKNYKII